MNKEDKLYFFMIRAIGNTDSDRRYFVDLKNSILFSLEQNHIFYFNSELHSENDKKNAALYPQRIAALDKDIVEITPISHQVKLEFLKKFINELPNDEIRVEVEKEILATEIKHDFDLKSLRQLDKRRYLDFDIMKNNFLINCFLSSFPRVSSFESFEVM